jgi:glycogen debranching enzyme
MPANHEKYQADGRYWQGGVWAPTNYMIIKGLQKNGYPKLAFDLASKHHAQVMEVFRKTNTFWEYYAPESADPGLLARPDFIGWTGLVPISVLFESIFGINPDYLKKTIDWHVNLTAEHGIDRYPIGPDGMLSLKCAARSSSKQRPSLEINSNTELKLVLSWEGGSETFPIKQGINRIG